MNNKNVLNVMTHKDHFPVLISIARFSKLQFEELSKYINRHDEPRYEIKLFCIIF